MRHQTNHKGTPPNCAACAFSEEFDKTRKLERKVLSVAKPAHKPKRRDSGKGFVKGPLYRV
jgi:hypothetical protein